MKLIIPLDEREGLGSRICDHFGSAPFFALVETETGELNIIDNSCNHHEHGQCTPADSFVAMGVQAVLCNGIGAGAASKLQMLGIEIFMAGPASNLGDALGLYRSGSLVKVTQKQVCSGHSCH
jgi:predicted Fe-Mo cluster-binding NifX family protein